MDRFRVVPFEPEHYLEAIRTTTIPVDPWRNVQQEAAMHRQAGPAFTGYVGDEIAAVAGVHVQIPGRGECWAVLTDTGRRHPFFVTRSTIRYLRAIIDRYKLIRVEADVVAEFWCGRYWVERMGFREEAIKRRYCAGVDFAAYVLLPEMEVSGG